MPLYGLFGSCMVLLVQIRYCLVLYVIYCIGCMHSIFLIKNEDCDNSIFRRGWMIKDNILYKKFMPPSILLYYQFSWWHTGSCILFHLVLNMLWLPSYLFSTHELPFDTEQDFRLQLLQGYLTPSRICIVVALPTRVFDAFSHCPSM